LLNDTTTPPKFLLRATHNWWLNILSDTGLIGIAAVILCWGLLLRFLWRYRHYEHWSIPKLGVLGTLGAFAVHTMFDTPEYWVILMATLLFAVLYISLEPAVDEPHHWQKLLSMWWVPVWVLALWFGYHSWQSLQSYEAGLKAASEHDWHTALEQFEAAQSQISYPESSYQLAAATTYALLAQNDAQYLPQAIIAYETLITLEPGWPTNHANLAALYWANKQPDLAVSAMQTAVQLAPEIPVYSLNLALWYADLGQTAAAQEALRDNYQLIPTWREASFWQTDLAYEAIKDLPSEQLQSSPELLQKTNLPFGWAALKDDDYTAAATLFSQQIVENPHESIGYLGRSITFYLEGKPREAQKVFQQARLLGLSHLFWQDVIVTQLDLNELLRRYASNSTYSHSTKYASIYAQSAFMRQGMAYDLIPQLTCFASTPLLKQDFDILTHGLFEQNAVVNEYFLADGSGLRPCVTLAH
jgi:lipoprotein NlpI